MENKKDAALTSEELTGLKLSTPKTTATGPKAVSVALSHIMEETGVVKGLSALNKMNQFDGFDCPGCAWPDPGDHRSKLGEYCENGAKALAEEATNKRVTPDFFARYSTSELAKMSDYEIGKSGRITHPMIIRQGEDHYMPTTWQNAFQVISKHLNALASPNEGIFYTSGRTSNEAAFLYQLFVRKFGTNNLPDCSNMCHESSGKALSSTLGIGKGSIKLEDFDFADLIIVVGQNPGTNHPRMLTALQQAKQKGAKIISINPLKETGLLRFRHPQKVSEWLGSGTELTDLYLQVRLNADVQLFKAILKLMLEEERKSPGSVFDHEFIKDKTSGYQELIEDLDTHDLDALISETSLEEGEIRKAADMILKSDKIIACWAMGLTQHENAVDNIREIVNLLLLKGSIGKQGAGTCPVRGHSNVQGDRTMGIWEAPPEAFLNKIQDNFGFDPPRDHGYDTVEAIKAMHSGKAKVFFAMGGNFLSATPDTQYTADALRSCDLTVQVSTKLNRSHLVHGKTAIILPCLGRSEVDVQNETAQFVSVENSMGIVHSSRGSLQPASEELKSEPWIIAELAKATFGTSEDIDWDHLISNYDHIRNAIEKTIPGFEDYNKRVRLEGGFYLPNGAREGSFNTPGAKALFTINKFTDHQCAPDELLMMTIRSHDQFNTTIYGLHDRYRGIYNERRVVLMHKDDMKARGIVHKQMVDLSSNYNGSERWARSFHALEYNIPKGCVATYFPEANVLVPIDSVARISNTPASKSIRIKVIKSQA